MGFKLPNRDQWIITLLITIFILALANKVININAVSSGKGDILKAIPDDIFTVGIGYFIALVIAYTLWKISGYTGETFNKRSLITTIIVGIIIVSAYIFILEPFTSTGHLPMLKLAAAQVKTTMQSFIAP